MPTTIDHQRERRQAIIDILDGRQVSRQSELVALLRRRGIAATQSSISRDLHELGIVKTDAGYRLTPSPLQKPPEAPTIAGFVRDIDTAGGHLVVVKTDIGAAQRVAVFLDRTGWPEIVGTVSGDDTIFVATQNGQRQRQLLARLRHVFG